MYLSYSRFMSHIWTSHVFTFVSHIYIFIWVFTWVSHINESRLHVSQSHLHIIELEWVTSSREWVTSTSHVFTWVSHIYISSSHEVIKEEKEKGCVYESCHTYEGVTSTYQRVMSHRYEWIKSSHEWVTSMYQWATNYQRRERERVSLWVISHSIFMSHVTHVNKSRLNINESCHTYKGVTSSHQCVTTT